MKFTRLLVCLAAVVGCGAVFAQAADYPNRPVQVLVGFPPGGSADIVGRYIMKKMSEVTGNQYVVENRTGAGGNLAFAATAAAKPDGYTLVFSTPGIAINPSLYKKVSYGIDDFTPIALIGEAPLVLLINPKLPIQNVKELVEAGKKAPDAIRFASSGNGSSSHLAMDVLRAATQMQYLHIPYRGGGPAMIDLMAGQVDITMLPISESMPYIKDNRVRSLGQTGKTRAPIAPDMPTIAEMGVPGYSSTTWYMLLGPAHLPPEIVAKLQKQISDVLAMPDLRERLKDAGVSIINGNATESKAFLQSEYKRWAELIKASGTQIE
jgi:tripartite-type tricarboxylate transporter receptor subunit TctC